MHEDEVLKPTNTGRLVAALFPATTFVFEWGRVHPSEELQKLISDPNRLNLLVFPAEDALTPSCAQRQAAQKTSGSPLFCWMAPGNKPAKCSIAPLVGGLA